MTRIFIDHQKFSTQTYGGISRYFANLMQGIRHAPDMAALLGVLYAKNHYIRQEPVRLRALKPLLTGRRDAYAYRLNTWYCEQLLARNNFDLFHPTYYDPYFLARLRKPLVITIHDMTYERLPEYFWAHDPLTRQKRLNIERADRIIAISETTKNDLLAYAKADPAKIDVIYHGIDLETPLRVKPVANLPEPYLLFVGDRSGYKNFYLFMNAFRQLADRYPELHLVLTGGGPMGVADEELIDRLGLRQRVRPIQAGDEELAYLYQQAALFVYPSLHEGFGLPILEAFQAGCPMVLSDTPCFREVAGDAALYFAPASADDLVHVIDTALTDTALRAQLVMNGTRRLRRFPLTKSVQETLDVYRALS